MPKQQHLKYLRRPQFDRYFFLRKHNKSNIYFHKNSINRILFGLDRQKSIRYTYLMNFVTADNRLKWVRVFYEGEGLRFQFVKKIKASLRASPHPKVFQEGFFRMVDKFWTQKRKANQSGRLRFPPKVISI